MKDLITIPKEITKTALKSKAQEIIDVINSGEIEPIDAYLQIKIYEEIIKEIKKGAKDAIFESAEKYVKDDLFPVKVEISQTGDRIDYAQDKEYADIQLALKSREQKLKTAYKQSLEGMQSIDITGEVIPVVPVKSHSESVVKITFKK